LLNITDWCFHEDGFADVCDGFGGGWTKEKNYYHERQRHWHGAIGVVLLFFVKIPSDILVSKKLIWSLTRPITAFLVFVSVIPQSISSYFYCFTHQYSRDDASSKSKPIVQSYRK
jgi:adenosylcobinamide-GDP ribazoletransferase